MEEAPDTEMIAKSKKHVRPAYWGGLAFSYAAIALSLVLALFKGDSDGMPIEVMAFGLIGSVVSIKSSDRNMRLMTFAFLPYIIGAFGHLIMMRFVS